MPVKQILLVDDSLPWQRFVREMFESEADLKIIATATDGSEAIQKARELQPDVILMEISLPRLNGFEATRQIRALSPASKIRGQVVLSCWVRDFKVKPVPVWYPSNPRIFR
jgi:CheY-like chemotaxis protein